MAIYIKMTVYDALTEEVKVDNEEQLYIGDKDPSSFCNIRIGNDLIKWTFREE